MAARAFSRNPELRPCIGKSASKMKNRAGLTLMELLLVMAVMVALMAMAAPMLREALFSERIRKAGDLVRADFGRARIMAMQSGRIVSFRFTPNSNTYIIQPIYGSTDATEIGLEEATGGLIEPLQEELPENIVFDDVVGKATSRDAYVQQSLQNNSDPTLLQMSPPILFYPDGTTSSAELMIRDEQNQSLVIRLRGLTGTSSVEEVVSGVKP